MHGDGAAGHAHPAGERRRARAAADRAHVALRSTGRVSDDSHDDDAVGDIGATFRELGKGKVSVLRESGAGISTRVAQHIVRCVWRY